jgi:hypothetical protein
MNYGLRFGLDITPENTLTRNVGFQVCGPNTDRLMAFNVKQLSDDVNEGKVLDINGEVAKAGSIIMCFARIDEVQTEKAPAVRQYRTLSGQVVTVGGAAKPAGGSDLDDL